jgi:hypothetical protein
MLTRLENYILTLRKSGPTVDQSKPYKLETPSPDMINQCLSPKFFFPIMIDFQFLSYFDLELMP